MDQQVLQQRLDADSITATFEAAGQATPSEAGNSTSLDVRGNAALDAGEEQAYSDEGFGKEYPDTDFEEDTTSDEEEEPDADLKKLKVRPNVADEPAVEVTMLCVKARRNGEVRYKPCGDKMIKKAEAAGEILCAKVNREGSIEYRPCSADSQLEDVPICAKTNDNGKVVYRPCKEEKEGKPPEGGKEEKGGSKEEAEEADWRLRDFKLPPGPAMLEPGSVGSRAWYITQRGKSQPPRPHALLA